MSTESIQRPISIYQQATGEGCQYNISAFQQQAVNGLNKQAISNNQVIINKKEDILDNSLFINDEQEISIEVCMLTQANIPVSEASSIVPLRSHRFTWASDSLPPQVVEYQIEASHSLTNRNFPLTCLVYFKVENKEDQILSRSTFSLQLEKVFIAQGFRNLVRELKAKRGDKINIKRLKVQNQPFFSLSLYQKDSNKQLTESSKTATPTSFDNSSFKFGDSLLQDQVDQFMSKEVKKKQGRQYDITVLPIITDISQLIYQSYPTKKFVEMLQNAQDKQKCQPVGSSNVVGPMLMTINQERCQIEFQPSNQVSDFITPLKARGYRWAGQGQAPKSYSVKIILVDEQGEQWPMTHILKFHPAKTTDSEYPVMRFKISNFLGWRKFNKRWNVQKGDRLQIFKQTTTNKVLIKVKRSSVEQTQNNTNVQSPQAFKLNDNFYKLDNSGNSFNISISQAQNPVVTSACFNPFVNNSLPTTQVNKVVKDNQVPMNYSFNLVNRLQGKERYEKSSKSFVVNTGNSNQSFTTHHPAEDNLNSAHSAPPQFDINQPQNNQQSNFSNQQTNFSTQQENLQNNNYDVKSKRNEDQKLVNVFQQYTQYYPQSQDLQPNQNYHSSQTPISNNNSFELYRNFSLQKKDFQSSFDLYKIFTAQQERNDQELLRRIMQENMQKENLLKQYDGSNYQDQSHESCIDSHDFVDRRVIEHFPSYANEALQNFLDCSMDTLTPLEPTQFIERTITNLSDLYI